MDKGNELYKKAKKFIPGGTQLLSKRPEMFLPEGWPSYYSKCSGVEVWDLDDRKFTDMTIFGVGACILGYADSEVDAAVSKAIAAGNMSTLNAPEEVELAELLCDIHPWAEMARYARSGGESMAIAIRIARAATGKEKILFCGYHGWHDWYLSANLSEDSALDGHLLPGLNPRGIPRGLMGTAIPFYYNDLKGFEALIAKHGDDVAGVVMEPMRSSSPEKGFLEAIRNITKDKNIPLVFDEITSGFRMNSGGIHLRLGVEPDIAVFAKGMSNGYPMAAIIGRSKFMDAAQNSFISSTYWTDKIGPAAALATIKKHVKYDVGSHLIGIGESIQEGWKGLAQRFGLNINISGIPPLSHWQIESDDSQLIHTVITEKMLEKGFLSSKAFYASFAHTKEHVEAYFKALNDVVKEIMPCIKEGNFSELHTGQEAHKGFKRLA